MMMLVLQYFFGNHFTHHMFIVLCLGHILLSSCKHHAARWQRPFFAPPYSPLISILVLSHSFFYVSVWLNGNWHYLFSHLRHKIRIIYDITSTSNKLLNLILTFMLLTCILFNPFFALYHFSNSFTIISHFGWHKCLTKSSPFLCICTLNFILSCWCDIGNPLINGSIYPHCLKI